MSLIEMDQLGAPYEAQEAELLVVGIAALIVVKNVAALDDEQLQILTVRQKQTKVDTGQLPGLLSVVQETIKFDPLIEAPESPTSTVIGAMDEVLDAQGMDDVGHHFHRVVGPRHEIPLLSLPGSAGGIEVVVYDGPLEYPFHPAEENEIDGSPQWRTVSHFLADPSARSTSKELLGFAVGKGMLTAGMRQQHQPVFPPGHNFDQHRQLREALPDITKIRRN